MPRPPQLKSLAPDRQHVAKRIAKNVRGHWRIGRRAKESEESVSTLVATLKVNPHTLRKNRQFAERYSEAELDRLLEGRRPNGLPLHWGHVIYLLTIADDDQRRKMEQRALREGWQAPRLAEAVQRLNRSNSTRSRSKGDERPVGGRPVKVPKNSRERLLWLAEETARWRARYEASMQAEDRGPGGSRVQTSRDVRLAAELRRRLTSMDRAARKVQRCLEKIVNRRRRSDKP